MKKLLNLNLGGLGLLAVHVFLFSRQNKNLYCIWSLKNPAHHIPNQTEIATEEFCPKSLLRKHNEIDFIESHIQILHHLKIVQKILEWIIIYC